MLRAGGDQCFEIGAVSVVLAFQAAILQGAADGGEQLFALERLEQVVVGAVAQRLQGDLDIVDGGHHDDRHVGILFLGALEEGDAVHLGHHQVGEDEIEFLARFEQGHGFDAAGGLPGAGTEHRPAWKQTISRIVSSSSTTRIRSCGMAWLSSECIAHSNVAMTFRK